MNEIIEDVLVWKNLNNGSIMLKEGSKKEPKVYVNCPKDENIRGKLIKKLSMIEIGDMVSLEMSGYLYIDIDCIKKGENSVQPQKLETQRVSNLEKQMQPIAPQTFQEQKEQKEREYWENKAKRENHQMSILAAQKNTIQILDIMERMGLLKDTSGSELENLRKMKQKEYYNELMEELK